MNLKHPLWMLLGVAALGTAAPNDARAGEVLIYRCTDADGRLTLRDTPCRTGEKQQTRSMLRPTDPPPKPRAATAPVTPAAAPPERTRVVVMTAPRPLYECVTPEGERYTSETDAGQPRWQPLWGAAYPAWPGGGHYVPGGISGRVGGRIGGDGRYNLRFGDRGTPRPGPHRGPHPGPFPGGVVYPVGGAWVRDACHPLPVQEVCARLRDRRYELDRRYHSALQSERVRITTEQRGIDARLANDCGAN